MRRTQAVEIGTGIRMGGSQKVEEQDAKTVEIALWGRRLAGEDFRREIHRRARHSRRVGPLRTAGTKVHEDDAAAVLAHDVLRFDVAVDEAGRVDRGQRPAQIDPDGRRLSTAEGSVGPQPGFESLAVDELHPEPRGAVANVGTINGDDVGMTDPGERARLGQQPLDRAECRAVAA